MAGPASSSTDKGDSLIATTLINTAYQQQATRSPLAPPSLSLKHLQLKNNKVQSSSAPFALLDGEFLVGKEEESSNPSTSIIFVLPDNRGVRGYMYITNFRLYFRAVDAEAKEWVIKKISNVLFINQNLKFKFYEIFTVRSFNIC